jgi:hypothetical protein
MDPIGHPGGSHWQALELAASAWRFTTPQHAPAIAPPLQFVGVGQNINNLTSLPPKGVSKPFRQIITMSVARSVPRTTPVQA